MAVIPVDISADDYTVDQGDLNAGDTLELTGLGSNTLTVDNVNAIADIDPDAAAAGTPTFALINDGNLTVNIGQANLFGLDGINYEVGDGSEMTLNGSLSQAGFVGPQSIDFTGEGGGTFLYAPGESGPEEETTVFEVTNLSQGDAIWVESRTNGSFEYDATRSVATLTYGGSGGSQETVAFEIHGLTQDDYEEIIFLHGGSNTGFGEFISPVCFLRGTLIQTAKGEVAVEDLVPGDTVIGQSGERTVKWVGFRKTFTKQIAPDRRAEHMPIRIVRDAIADNVPSKDIVVSPGHHVLVEGKLVRTQDLVNGKTIYQETHHVSYEYFHVELDQFDVISAHGLMSESWADGGNRDYFQNADVTTLRPEDRQRRRADRPGFVALRKGPEVERLQSMYAARAEQLQQEQDAQPVIAYG
ncbi:Hint domain-containing protein [Bordetella tumulicola]|uniref:Hint domain-containing protein n=1 Tax=Bordetella tumulicola TaxID=1649133 RepID=UPI0039EE687E